MKIFALALALAIAGFGQVLDSVAGGKLELRGTIDRPVFVNHSGQDVVYVAAIQEYVGAGLMGSINGSWEIPLRW